MNSHSRARRVKVSALYDKRCASWQHTKIILIFPSFVSHVLETENLRFVVTFFLPTDFWLEVERQKIYV